MECGIDETTGPGAVRMQLNHSGADLCVPLQSCHTDRRSIKAAAKVDVQSLIYQAVH